MADISIDYLGIKLKNPVIAGASNLWSKAENIEKVQEAGAGALVYKSLFEEQIQLERLELDEITTQYDERHAMMTDVFPDVKHAGPEEHLSKLREVKRSLKIPLIASLNAVNNETWTEYAKKIEDAGVNAIELNFYATPRESKIECDSIEEGQIKIIENIKNSIKIPVSVKLSCFYTNPLNLISKMDSAGVDGFVIFNRFFQPDIEISGEKHIRPFDFSKEGDYRLPLRFAGLLFSNIDADICTSSGIFSGADIIKLLLAGSTCIQTVSAIYKKGVKMIGSMKEELSSWMDEKGYRKIEDFKGKLSKKNTKSPFVYQRAQYVDLLMRSDDIIKDRPI